MALTTVQPVRASVLLVKSHEGRRAAVGARRAEQVHRAIVTDLEVLEDGELVLLPLVGDALRSGVDLLLPLLATATETEDQVKSGLLLDVVIRESAAIVELLAGEDQTLLVRRNALLVRDLALDSLDGVTRLDLKGDCLSRQRLNENLHFHW